MVQRLITGFYADASAEANRLLQDGWEVVPGTIGVTTVHDEQESPPQGPQAKTTSRKVFRQVMWIVVDDGYELLEVDDDIQLLGEQEQPSLPGLGA